MTQSEPTEDFIDSASRPEARGIELIDDSERHGKARDLFFIWAAPGVSILNLTIGATLILLGLEIWQAALVIVASACLWVFPGIIAGSGPAAATAMGGALPGVVFPTIGMRADSASPD